jgi:predicted kinase
MMILLCGMIASGKGTFARELATKGFIVVNDDSVVSACHGGDYILYQKKYKGIYKQTEVATILAALQVGANVVIDRPNFRRRTRGRYIGLAHMFDTPVVCVTFPRVSPLEHAERRFKSDPRGLPLEHWIEAATRHHADWEEPRMEDGLDNIFPVEVARQMVEEGKL